MQTIMISGKAGSGKTTLAKDLSLALIKRGYDVRNTRFARKLYEMHDQVVKIAQKTGINVPEKNRDVLQFLGTSWIRRLDPDAWVKCVKKDITEAKLDHIDFVIIDDLRFVNEFNGIDAITIRLNASEECRKARCSAWTGDHESETGLDQYADEGRFDMWFDSELLSSEKILSLIIAYLKENRLLPLK